jgi:hypothetical protein
MATEPLVGAIWKGKPMNINSISDFRRAMRHGAYAWPGGYPCYFVMSDGEALSFKAAKVERRLLLEALVDYATNEHERSGWRPVAVEVNWEDETLVCAHTNEPIESAYSEEHTTA